MNMPKFRVWCTSSFDSKVKMMIHFDDIQLIDLWQMFFVHRSNYRWDEVDYHNDIFMRSTELYDKNDVEIFEGDILHDKEKSIKFVVNARNGCFVADEIENRTYLWEVNSRTEVIGNIYENPELLEGVEQ